MQNGVKIPANSANVSIGASGGIGNELGRRSSGVTLVAFHAGTTAVSLSCPFQASVAKKNIQSGLLWQIVWSRYLTKLNQTENCHSRIGQASE